MKWNEVKRGVDKQGQSEAKAWVSSETEISTWVSETIVLLTRLSSPKR